MKKFFLDTKATLGLVSDKTVDEDYEKRSAGLKTLHDATSSYQSSMEKVKHAGKEFVKALEEASKAFEKLNADDHIPSELKQYSKEFKEMVEKIQKGALLQFTKEMDAKVITSGSSLKGDCEACSHLEQERSKAVNEYDVYRDTVSKKEAEYAKKGKNLKDSKGYEEEVKQRDHFKSVYETANKSFKEKHDELLKKLVENNKACAKEFADCTTTFLKDLSKEMERLEKASSGFAK
ncbi:uncharacterized protein TM35_000121110 [Trypanosoma theileri]|uniref:BAR domain-containing protein n=1 Tax=Trypanosoma theileri TaxID=67003 RepID=A0A1X0NXA8_9TRYP|nr:uncharacterized protein TM35_000121110 [Trypanosoma theileri]ORC89336.1 hypothetical protein TM35_000121110 [Trypanosoma theileri]